MASRNDQIKIAVLVSLFTTVGTSQASAVCTHPINYQPAPLGFIFDTEDTLEHPYIRGVSGTSIELTPLGLILTDEQAVAQTQGNGRRVGMIQLLLLGHYALDDAFRDDHERLCNKTPQEVEAIGTRLLQQLLDRKNLTHEQLNSDAAQVASLAQQIGKRILLGVGYTQEDINQLRQLANSNGNFPSTYAALHNAATNGYFGNLFDKVSQHFRRLLN